MSPLTSDSNCIVSNGVGFIRHPMSQSSTFWRLLITGFVLVMMASGWLINLQDVDTQDKIGIAAFYGGREPKSSWVSVKGRLFWDGAGYEGNDHYGTWYVPMVSRGWRSGDQVKLIVKVSSTAAEDWGEIEEVDGILNQGVPDYVETFFADEGPPLAEGARLLRAGAEPGEQRRFAHIVIVAGLLAIGGSLLLYDPNPHDPSKKSHSLAKPRLLGPRPSDLAELRGEITPDDPMIVEREDAVQQWMREHGLETNEPQPAEEPDSEEQLA